MAEEKEIENKNDTKNDNDVAYCECDIYQLYNDMESPSTLILDVRSADDYNINHILNSEYFEIPFDFKYTTPNDLLLKLNKNIGQFKVKVSDKLATIKSKDNLLIYCYGNELTKNKTEKFNVLYQLSLIFGLKKNQLKILKSPGFISFEKNFPFLCSKYIAEEELKKATNFSSMLDALKNKNKFKNDGTLYGKIKSQDRKYPNSIIFDKLFLGNSEHSKNLKVLQQLGITHIINATLQFKNEFESFGDIKYLQVAIDDNINETFEPYWPKIMQFMKCIDDDDNNNAIFVHCEMGISRSATIIIAYLMYKLKISLYDAYVYVHNKRGIIRPNQSFLKQLEKYEKQLFNGVSTLEQVNKEIRHIHLQQLSTEQQQ